MSHNIIIHSLSNVKLDLEPIDQYFFPRENLDINIISVSKFREPEHFSMIFRLTLSINDKIEILSWSSSDYILADRLSSMVDQNMSGAYQIVIDSILKANQIKIKNILEAL